MAQEPARQGNMRNYSEKWFDGTEDIKSQLIDFYASNNQLMNSDPTMLYIFNRYVSTLFAKGLSFKFNGRWVKPKRDVKSIFDNHWTNFLTKALWFMFDKNYLVWFAARSPKGFIYPDVPDPSQLDLKKVRDSVSGVASLKAFCS